MLDKLLTSLQEIPAYSIFISAVVVIFIAVSVLTMFGKARQEKEIDSCGGTRSVRTWHCMITPEESSFH